MLNEEDLGLLIENSLRDIGSNNVILHCQNSNGSFNRPDVIVDTNPQDHTNKRKDRNKKRGHRDIFKIHPGNVKYSELAKSMRPVVIPGATESRYTKGIVGAIEGIDFDTEQKEYKAEEDVEIQDGALVWAQYGMFLEGSDLPFDSSIQRLNGKPELLKVSPSYIMPCLAVAIRWMCPGQRGRFVLPPSAFGEYGILETVPANTPVLLLMHIVKSLDAGIIHRYDDLDPSMKKDFNIVSPMINIVNQIAKDFFFRKRIIDSIDLYKRALEMAKGCCKNKNNKNEIDQVLVKIYVNLALSVSLDKTGNIGEVLDYLDQSSALEDHFKNCKALFLRGKCYLKLNQYDDAKHFLLKSFELEPHNEEINAELGKLEDILSKSKSVEVKIGKRIANRKDELSKEQIKIKEKLVSNEDKLRVQECCKTLIKQNNHTSTAASRSLLDEEISLLDELLQKNGGLRLIRKKEKN